MTSSDFTFFLLSSPWRVTFSFGIEFAHAANMELIQGTESCSGVGGSRGHFPGGNIHVAVWLSTSFMSWFWKVVTSLFEFQPSHVVDCHFISVLSMPLSHGSVAYWNIALKGPQKLAKRKFSIIYVHIWLSYKNKFFFLWMGLNFFIYINLGSCENGSLNLLYKLWV